MPGPSVQQGKYSMCVCFSDPVNTGISRMSEAVYYTIEPVVFMDLKRQTEVPRILNKCWECQSVHLSFCLPAFLYL